MLQTVSSTLGSIDILVNNAGGALPPHKLDEIEEKHWDLVLNVNLKGAFFSCQLAYNWGEKGLRVTGVVSTVTMTGNRVKNLWEDKGKSEQDSVLKNIPLRRLSTPKEIAAAVVFLASEEASYIAGITIDVSGGRYLH